MLSVALGAHEILFIFADLNRCSFALGHDLGHGHDKHFGEMGRDMAFKKSHKIAGGILLAVVLYFAMSALFRGDAPEEKQDEPLSAAEQTPLVTAATSRAVMHPALLEIRGRTAPDRAVVVRAETSGRVLSLPVPEGQTVKAGQIICALEVKARQAQVEQARANLASRQLEYEAAQTLEDKGYRSATATKAAKATYDAARAGLKAAEAELENTRLRAPFSGLLDSRPVDRGDLLSTGQACGTVVDLNPIVITGYVTEGEAQRLKAGQSATAVLSTGNTVTGTVRFVARTPEDTTKTFRVEVEVPNPTLSIATGASAVAKVAVGEAMAHKVPPSILSLNAEGQVGVRILDESDIVRFVPVEILEETSEAVWIGGLEDEARIITVGQDYVREGKAARVQATGVPTQGAERVSAPEEPANEAPAP